MYQHRPPNSLRRAEPRPELCAVRVPAKRGDVVCFSIHTIHGSPINETESPRRLVRVGYRDPENKQTAGQSLERPGLMVQGYRKRSEGQELLKQS